MSGVRVQGLASLLSKSVRAGIVASRLQQNDGVANLTQWQYSRTFSALPARGLNGGEGEERRWSRGPLVAAGAFSFSFAASSSSSTAVAKERPLHEFVPKELVLYQYEACTFCNKVKGMIFVI